MGVRSSTRCVRFTGIALGLLLTAWAPAAAALPANLTATMHLRAGPSVYYPSVALMPAGALVEVLGCEAGYDWCDVQAGADRGWVDAAYLAAAGPGGPLVIAGNAVVLGVPTVAFVFNTYWGNNYDGRPWYGRRDFYYNYWNRYPHGRPPPPPGKTRPPRRGRPPGNTRPGGRPGGRPSDSGRAPGDGRPPPRDDQSRPQPRPGQ